MKNEDYAKEYAETRGLKPKTHLKMTQILNHYSTFQGLTIEELLNEADKEEEEGIRWKRRTLKNRLTNYMNYCKSNMLLSSAKSYVNYIKSFYAHHEIELGQLPKWNTRNANLPDPITSKDMLTKDVIREALKVANPVMSSIILLEASSGMTRSDVLSLTIQDFLEATQPYHEKTTIQEALPIMLNHHDDIIPTFKLRRAKTNKYFITFASPEATREICKYLQIRDKRNHKYHRNLLTNVDKLFKIHPSVYIDKFNEINVALNKGKAGTYNRFRGHMLRKFHATSLEKSGMSRALINTMQGKSNNQVDDVYFIADENTLRDEYINALEGVLIYTDVKEVTRYSPEYQRLQQENQHYKDNLEQLWDELHDLKKRSEVWDRL